MTAAATGTILDKIVAFKRQEIASRAVQTPPVALEKRLAAAPPPRDFRQAIDRPGTVQIIAEVKKASPSAGVLRPDFDPVAIARIYQQHGAAALSVLTDEHFFQGSLSYLTAIRALDPPPVLRKDFILDAYQVLEARVAGADAVLLVAEILTDPELRSLQELIRELGMQALVELHDSANLQRVVDSGAQVIGINNRDLRAFTTRLEHTLALAEKVPASCCLVSESGIRTRQDVLKLQAIGVRAVLIGETLMRAGEMGAKLDELRGA